MSSDTTDLRNEYSPKTLENMKEPKFDPNKLEKTTIEEMKDAAAKEGGLVFFVKYFKENPKYSDYVSYAMNPQGVLTVAMNVYKREHLETFENNLS